MMDILICGAPLDNSFQKAKLELVNKGSLGRRRKPTRANLKNLLSPSNHTPQTLSVQKPAASCEKPVVNGYSHKERNSPSNFRLPLRIEPSLPRTSPEPNHVADAQQFSIEAKLKRKKSDVGRSAVLIQTWERRTWSNSLTKQKEAAKATSRHSTCSRFQNKENLRNHTMPEPHACPRYAGIPQNGESFKKGGLVSRVRDQYSDDAMLYRMSENVPRHVKPLHMNGHKLSKGSSEPEWISLSKKLCAKFVEGHIEPNSADSYLHEEPDGVKQPQQVSNRRLHQTASQHQTIPQKVEEKKPKKVVEMTPPKTTGPDEPPWIHLSRKLCTKFIEEHIEYPAVPCDASVKNELAVEPNGDVRIIEKIGKPKGRKSKVRKEAEPEWVTLSKKLRAKFIESHIDDPDTISMDNQLNVSDLELSSESLSDASQEVVISKNICEYKGSTERNVRTTEDSDAYRNRFQVNSHSPTVFPEKECCWEYQEMEFDQESNSGTFQGTEFFEQPINSSIKQSEVDAFRTTPVSGRNIEKPPLRVEDNVNFTSFAETVNSKMFPNAECYNNDVTFAPREIKTEKSANKNSANEKKAITVQFVSHCENNHRDFNNIKHSVHKQKDASPERNNGQCTFFNLTTWEEAHCKSDDNYLERSQSPLTTFKLKKELRSKSMDNVSNSEEKRSNQYEKCNPERSKNNMHHINIALPSKGNTICKSEDILDKLECKISTHNGVNISKTREEKSENYEVNENSVCKISINQFNESSESFDVSERDEFVNCGASRLLSTGSYESFDNDPPSRGKNVETCEASGSEVQLNISPKVSQRNCIKVIGEFGEETSEICHKSKGKTRSEDFETSENNTSLKSPAHNSNSFESTECDDTSLNCVPDRKNSSEKNEALLIEVNNNCNENKLRRKVSERNEATKKYDEPPNCQSNKNISKSNSNINGYDKQSDNLQCSSDNRQYIEDKKINQKTTGMKKHYKCNGIIPNTKEIVSNKALKIRETEKQEIITNGSHSESQTPVNDKGVNHTNTKILCINEYANISSSIAESKSRGEESASKMGRKSKSVHSVFHEIPYNEDSINNKKPKDLGSRRNSSGEYPDELTCNVPLIKRSAKSDDSSCTENSDSPKSNRMKIKSHSLYDISKNEDNYEYTDDLASNIREPKQNGCSNGVLKSKNGTTMKFQEFASESDIPLCAKLVAKQNGKLSTRSVSSSSNRNTSPGSESSHVYEDMFKETTSCPSDSETSSWTVMKNNSYYINGRSSSLNDLDLSDSCSMSVKCDYASSGSEQSTLQSRHSSCTSSSFYVNLRDYDSHMLEPSLNKKKKDHRKITSNGNSSKMASSNPPTPESLRHLFTSPFHSIHSPANRTSRLVNRLPQEPESHYYSTAAATSSAFKHGFDPTPPKPKKTERSSSVKIKDIAHGIILTFRRFQNHSKSSHVSPTHYVDVSHLAESNHPDSGKSKSKKEQKESSKKQGDQKRWGFSPESIRTDSDSGCHITSSDVHCTKARRSSSDLTSNRQNFAILNADMKSRNGSAPEKKKTKVGKKNSTAREKGKKTRSKSVESRAVSTVSRKVQQMPDGTLYLVTTVSGDTALPGVYSDSPDSSSELSSHRPIKSTGESNC